MPVTGEIAEILGDIRFFVDDPSLKARYPDARLFPRLKTSFRSVLRDILLVSTQPPIARYTFTTVANQFIYPLPPSVSEILKISQVSKITGLDNYGVRPQSFWNPLGAGYLVEGTRQIRFVPTPQSGGEVITVAFYPNGDGEFYRADVVANQATTTTIKLNTTPEFGVYPTDPLAFIGHFVNAFEATGGVSWPAEVRQITAYSESTRTITVDPAFSTDPSGFAPEVRLSVEITPDLLRPHKHLLALHVARFISSLEKRQAGFLALNRMYNDEKRSIMLIAANAEGRVGQHWGNDTADNTDYWDGGW